jgi:hypothetical protein
LQNRTKFWGDCEVDGMPPGWRERVDGSNVAKDNLLGMRGAIGVIDREIGV